MAYILMHKSIPIVDLDLNEAPGSIQKLGEAYHKELLPLRDRYYIMQRRS